MKGGTAATLRRGRVRYRSDRRRLRPARFTAFIGTLLAANVGAYLVWSVIPIFVAGTCR